jgi:acetate---CoA ligase (ADP-forming)
MAEANLKRLLQPRHIAFVGGTSMAPAIDICRAAGFNGPIWPVNPRHDTLAGLPTFATVGELPEAPDATFLYVSRENVIEVIGELAAMGAGGAVCHAAGFSEMGEAGQEFHDALVAAAGALALVGPNSNGILNNVDGVMLWPINGHVPEHYDSGVAIITQSGGIAFNYIANKRSVHAAYVISTGNQAVLDPGVFIRVLADDPRVTAIGLFLEGINDVAGFSEAAAHALERNVPIVVLKVGRTELGAAMARTHTGSLAHGDDFFQALFERLGIVRAHSLSSFDETIKMVATAGLPEGRKLAALTNSGALRTITADLASDADLELPPPSAGVAAALRDQVSHFAVISNPLDYNAAYAGAEGLTMENEPALHQCFSTMISDDYDVVMMLAFCDWPLPKDGEPDDKTILAWLRACGERGVPSIIASSLSEAFSEPYREFCLKHGVAPLQGIEDAMAAVAAAVRAGEWRRLIDEGGGPPSVVLPAPPMVPPTGTLLDEPTSKALLGEYGLPLAPHRVAAPSDVVHAAQGLGYPVAVKAINAEAIHKAKLGGVQLDLRDDDDVAKAVDDIVAGYGAHDLRVDQLLVEKMVGGADAELIIGCVRDPRFGLALVLGAGGTRVEAVNQTQMLLLPATATVLVHFVGRAMARLGVDEVAFDSILTAVAAVARFADDRRDTLIELDVNPLMVIADRAVAVDAVVHLADGRDE